MTRANGIDISKYQASFTDQGNIDFIIIKATEGLAKDPLFDQFCEDTKTVPRRAAYHYFRTAVDPVEQAEFFFDTQNGNEFKWLCVDYEKTHNTLDREGQNNLKIFWDTLDGIASPEVSFVLYTSPYIFRDNLIAYNVFWAHVPLWMAHYNGQDPETGAPNTWGNDWLFWQYSADGNRKGAEYGVGSVDVDLNVFNGSVEDMDNWLGIEEKPKNEPNEQTSLNLTIANNKIRIEELERKMGITEAMMDDTIEIDKTQGKINDNFTSWLTKLEQKAHTHPSWMARWFKR